jgi:predicted RND superfamily exporter protein
MSSIIAQVQTQVQTPLQKIEEFDEQIKAEIQLRDSFKKYSHEYKFHYKKIGMLIKDKSKFVRSDHCRKYLLELSRGYLEESETKKKEILCLEKIYEDEKKKIDESCFEDEKKIKEEFEQQMSTFAQYKSDLLQTRLVEIHFDQSKLSKLKEDQETLRHKSYITCPHEYWYSDYYSSECSYICKHCYEKVYY